MFVSQTNGCQITKVWQNKSGTDTKQDESRAVLPTRSKHTTNTFSPELMRALGKKKKSGDGFSITSFCLKVLLDEKGKNKGEGKADSAGTVMS